MNTRIFALAGLAAMATLASCKKDKNDGPVGEARVRYVNAVPSNLTLDIYENDNQAREDFVFKQNTAYVTVPAQSRKVDVNRANSNVRLVSQSVGLDDKADYTVFLARRSEADTSLQMIVSKDTLTSGVITKAHIRFMNLIPNSGQLILANNTAPMTGLKLRTYTGRTSFVDFDPASINLNVLKDDFTSIYGATPPATLTVFEAGKFYTVLAVGRLDQTGVATPAIVVVQHN